LAIRGSTIMKIGATLTVLGLLAMAGGAAAIYWIFLRDLPDFETLADYRPPLTSTVVDRQGRTIGEYYEFRRQLTSLDEVPKIAIDAFLAAEDDTFYEHSGVDFVSIARAAWVNLLARGEVRQGASTITQQMVKQLLLTPEQTYTRKIREMVLARRIKERFSKDEILYLYLNQIYFGSGAYGIGEAARTYFGKEIGEVDAGEAALLAGLPKAPGRNSPFLNPEGAERRRIFVLDRMLDEGLIDAATHADSVANPPQLVQGPNRDYEVAAYVTEEVRRRLVEAIGNDLVLHGGLRIETTLDLDLQRAGTEALQRGVETIDHRRGYRGPIRQIAAAETAAALDALAEENRLIGSDPAERFAAGPVRGLVLAVDDEAGVGRIAFAPELEADVAFLDVKWAHDASQERLHGQKVKRLSQALAVGDVASFRVARPMLESDDGEEVPAAEGWQANLYQVPDVQGALLSFDLESGDLLAMAGGYDFALSEFNRALQARRQPGSAFKPIVYATAVTRGFTPATILYDRPVVKGDPGSGYEFRPENYGRKFLGPITMAEALARSVNNASIHLLEDVGIHHVTAFSRAVGIRSPLSSSLGLALGVSSVTLLEITRAYGVIGAGGRYTEPRLIARVLDRDGEVILSDVWLDPGELTPPVGAGPDGDEMPRRVIPVPPERGELPEGYAMDPADAYVAASLLRGVVQHPRGTGKKAKVLGRPVGGKTGTTNDNTDAWFIGFSPTIVTGVWVGIDSKLLLGKRETGGGAAAPIWVDYMGSALATRPKSEFEVPPGIVFARVDAKTGKLASPGSRSTLFQPFLEGTAPTETSEASATATRSRRSLDLDF